MEQEPDLEIRRAEVVVELALGVVVQSFSRFDFHHEFVVDHHVEPLLGDLDATVTNSNAKLSGDAVAAVKQFELEGRSVDVLDKTEA